MTTTWGHYDEEAMQIGDPDKRNDHTLSHHINCLIIDSHRHSHCILLNGIEKQQITALNTDQIPEGTTVEPVTTATSS